MNKLKDLRTRIGFTQKQVADHLQTTQQTVQRWESGHTEIPATYLKDLSILFGSSVDHLLGIESSARHREGFANFSHDTPWGTLTVTFAFGTRQYPVDESEADFLRGTLHNPQHVTPLSEWPHFKTLDNKLVFLNPAFVEETALVTHDEAAMPFFASPEAYKALSFDALSEAGPLLLEECTKTLVHMGVANKSGKPDFDLARERLNSIEIVRGNGSSLITPLSEDVAAAVSTLQNELPEIGDNSFILASAEEGNYRSVNLAKVATIEVQAEAWLGFVSPPG